MSRAISTSVFEFVQGLVKQTTGIELHEGKDYLLTSRLQPIVKSEGLESIEDLISKLRGGAPSELRTRVINAMTTNETSFFRDVQPYRTLSKTVLPEIIERNAGAKRIRIWSAACSSGQEPYSIAMTMFESQRQVWDSWDVKVFASDVNSEMVERAASGSFSQLEVNRGMPGKTLATCFQRDGSRWAVKHHIRDAIEFRQHNLLQPFAAGPFDAVFLRNVLIYFNEETRGKILRNVRSVMREGAVLFVGSSESSIAMPNSFEPITLDRTHGFVAR